MARYSANISSVVSRILSWSNRPMGSPAWRRTATGLIGYRFDGRDDAVGPLLLRHEILHHVAVEAALLGRAVAVVLAGQNAAGQWRPSCQAKVQGLGHWDQLPLHASLDQTVFD